MTLFSLGVKSSKIYSPHGDSLPPDTGCLVCSKPKTIKPKQTAGEGYSVTVKAQGIGIVRVGDLTQTHNHPHTVADICTCVAHAPPLLPTAASKTVKVEKKYAAMVDTTAYANSSYYQFTDDPDDGPHYLKTGTTNVFIGK